MDLILRRHADAERRRHDEERRLTAKERRQAQRIAAWLRKKLPSEVTVLTSPARRALETAKALTDRFQIASQLDTGATAREILAAAGWLDGAGAVVVAGHQPELGRAAALILTGAESDWKFKKGAIWWFERDGDEVDASAALRTLVSPDSL